MEILGRARKSPQISENVGSVRKSLEIFGKPSETVQKYFSDVFMTFQTFRKIFGNLRKRFPDVIGNVSNGSQELKGFGARF